MALYMTKTESSPHSHRIMSRAACPPDLFNNVICAEILDPEQDSFLYDILKAKIIHDLCNN